MVYGLLTLKLSVFFLKKGLHQAQENKQTPYFLILTHVKFWFKNEDEIIYVLLLLFLVLSNNCFN